MKRGIDISYANGVVDFEKVKGLVDFVIMRAGYGRNNIDAQFKRNLAECIRLKIPFGVYWFSYALTVGEARQEAKYCLDLIKGLNVEWGVWFDLEYHSFDYAKVRGVTIDANAHALAFLEEVEKQGFYAGNYTNLDFAKRIFNSEVLAYPTWYARYRNNTANFPTDNVQHELKHKIWQYTSRGTVYGINGLVDLNIAYDDAEETPVTPKVGWIFDGKTEQWWYKFADGTYPKKQWLELEGKWYYFDEAGWMYEGWLLYKDDWYYLQPKDGCMVTDTLLRLPDGVYYVKPDGTLAYTDAGGRLV